MCAQARMHGGIAKACAGGFMPGQSSRRSRSARARIAVTLAVSSVSAFLFTSICARADDRSIDGSGNNLGSFSLGQVGSIYIREASGAHYADGISAPNGSSRPDARTISNTLMFQGEN